MLVLLLVLSAVSSSLAFRLPLSRSKSLKLTPLSQLHIAQLDNVVIESASSAEETPLIDYDWQKQWYAVTYVFNLPTKKEKKPYAFSIFDHEMVLWRDENNQLQCVEDRCPHRASKLSQGQAIDGKIECLYHGWQFSGSGDCVKIPQLPDKAIIPKRACVRTYATAIREGILWVWMGTPETADESKIPRTQVDFDVEKNKRAYTKYDFQIDLPYDHSNPHISTLRLDISF